MNNYKILSPFYYDTPLSNHIATELIEYLSGDRDVFTLPFTIRGTPFQQNVYQTLQAQVTYGQTISYKNLALLAGYPKAARAVGTAMKINPLPFIIPCHRVIRSNGNPGEYAMGASIKYFLLSLEKNFIPNSLH
ncbi:MAG: methylated-DNA--[protein]-cysteine S-methyltransferase [Candidatus Marinimicrobia bacterium]|nr:methylated-DNA--[protein]-cysteine S-methyltransferase [Candidatus Neomarinimicrobiota bacterium]MDD5581941.1 methylated-DNA--[protein]-cysteine S-methyltransferase [Candidatus Neomarinimicrobiota bacterium]